MKSPLYVVSLTSRKQYWLHCGLQDREDIARLWIQDDSYFNYCWRVCKCSRRVAGRLQERHVADETILVPGAVLPPRKQDILPNQPVLHLIPGFLLFTSRINHSSPMHCLPGDSKRRLTGGQNSYRLLRGSQGRCEKGMPIRHPVRWAYRLGGRCQH